ncbi:MAG: DUF5063 domain-containing protein [Blastocatellia bacterium]|nr:DUF5063 domain-containing protein [Blastocatellia bacterium]
MSEAAITHPGVQAFAEIAEKYCTWVEGPRGDADAEMRKVRKLLAELHAMVLRVKVTDRGEITAENMVPHEVWGDVFQAFRERLPANDYWEVSNPLTHDPDQYLVCNSLADDLADIYRDLKNGLALFQEGHLSEAAWEWRFSFEIHWGAHLMSAQRAIHSYLGVQPGSIAESER